MFKHTHPPNGISGIFAMLTLTLPKVINVQALYGVNMEK
jgi:hypothetical protein